ncbi:MAG: hypothetical protein IPK21_14455 [Haliscomenobacter sp.]|nr:hypothetical protein [Haliscomenobacter sp.]
MIENLYRLGKALQSDEKLANYFSPWQNPFPSGDTDSLNVIFFPITNGIVQAYEIEAFKPQLLKQYLYRKPAGANGAPLVPTHSFLSIRTKGQTLRQPF